MTATSTPLPVAITDAKGVTMHLVPAGKFAMGSDYGRENEKPVHQVYLDAFYVDIYEVTNALYKACVDADICTPPHFPHSRTHFYYYANAEFSDYPVIFVVWDQAKTYCEWRGAELPTEAQWEKAARGTDGRTYPWGEGIDCNKANYHDGNKFCVGDTMKVGSYESGKSPYGAYDLVGNVWEWTADWYSATYYDNSPAENPAGPDSGQYRVLRGDSWSLNAYDPRVPTRLWDSPDGFYYYDFGFRCAKDVP
jgi:formylglycine-generating enzyme required for sulfatase activity